MIREEITSDLQISTGDSHGTTSRLARLSPCPIDSTHRLLPRPPQANPSALFLSPSHAHRKAPERTDSTARTSYRSSPSKSKNTNNQGAGNPNNLVSRDNLKRKCRSQPTSQFGLGIGRAASYLTADPDAVSLSSRLISHCIASVAEQACLPGMAGRMIPGAPMSDDWLWLLIRCTEQSRTLS